MQCYHLLAQDERASEDRDMRSTLHRLHHVSRPTLKASVTMGVMLLLLSTCGNIFQYWSSGDSSRSQVAGIMGGVTRPFMLSTDWSRGNTTQIDELWKGLAPNLGMVAVGGDMVTNMELYSTEPFPWDSNKGVYMLEGYHSLHCLTYIYRALREFEQGLPQTTPMHHHIHCLDALRENAICSADDTLRPAGSDVGRPQNAGRWPHKQCRDWDQLERWALQKNSACFKRFPDGDPRRKTLEEWRWCPEGSPYIAAIDMFFGSGE